MNLHKLLFRRKHDQIEQLLDLASTMRDEIMDLRERANFLGHRTIDTPFIPTDIGFIETVQYSEDHGEITVYSLDRFHISRSYVGDKPSWKVINLDKGISLDVFIGNMRDGIIILKGLGFGVDRKSITDDFEGLNEQE